MSYKTNAEIDKWFEEEYLPKRKGGFIVYSGLADSPSFRRTAYERRVVDEITCSFGNCTWLIAPKRVIIGGWGPVNCPCESDGGWRKEYIDQRPKPRPAALPKGRRNKKKTKRSKSYLKHKRRMESFYS